MAFKARMKKGVNVMSVVKRLVSVIIGLWIGGTLLMEVGSTMTGTCSPFYKGFSLIGWKIGDNATAAAETTVDSGCEASNYILYDTVSQAGILAVVGLVALAGVVLSFVKFKF